MENTYKEYKTHGFTLTLKQKSKKTKKQKHCGNLAKTRLVTFSLFTFSMNLSAGVIYHEILNFSL